MATVLAKYNPDSLGAKWDAAGHKLALEWLALNPTVHTGYLVERALKLATSADVEGNWIKAVVLRAAADRIFLMGWVRAL